MSRRRIPVPSSTAAEVLFLADRTCCVCREGVKPVQIHHIDGNPANHAQENLAVLCFDCHRETQIAGGFDRKLDAEQVILYREDWNRIVAGRRATTLDQISSRAEVVNSDDVELVTSLVEIYREGGHWDDLALLYDSLGNEDLRDKYTEKAISDGIEPYWEVYLRARQGRTELLDHGLVERLLADLDRHDDRHSRARVLADLGRYTEAAHDYIQAVAKDLADPPNLFAAGYYLKEMLRGGILKALFVAALQQAAEKGDLWWQVRALEELGWSTEIDALLTEHAHELDTRPDLHPAQRARLNQLLAEAKQDRKRYVEEAKKASSLEARYGTVVAHDEEGNVVLPEELSQEAAEARPKDESK